MGDGGAQIILRVCERMPSARQLVAPAKAGVQGKRLKSLDSRLRGNDGMSGVTLISGIPSQALSTKIMAGPKAGAMRLT